MMSTRFAYCFVKSSICIIICIVHLICYTIAKDDIILDISHKFSPEAHFEHRGSIQVRPNRVDWLQKQDLLTEVQLKDLEKANHYFVKAIERDTNKTSETFVRACSLLSSDLNHILAVNLSPLQEFINLNLVSKDPDCLKPVTSGILGDLKSELKLEKSQIGPEPDTASFIRRQEEERKSKLRESKEENKSFLLKYWMYILPGVILLMLVSGGQEPDRR